MKAAPFDVPRPPRNENAVLVGHAGREKESLERSMDELALLADTADAKVIERVPHDPRSIHPTSVLREAQGDELQQRPLA